MSKSVLLIGLVFLGLGALLIVAYPFRQHRRGLYLVVPLCIVVMAICYYLWGGWSLWSSYLQQSAQKQQVQKIIKSVHGVDEIIDKLRVKLNQNPNSARGWYLLGRLYAHQGQWEKAKSAFETAHQLKPKSAKIAVNLAQSLLQLNHQAYNDNIRAILQQVLKNNDSQPDALAMLAMDAYSAKEYEKAIDYWRRILILMPSQSEEAQVIRKAIHKAQKAMEQ